MANPDPRCFPLVELEPDQIQALIYPALKGAAIASVERVEGGLVNTLYRVTPADGGIPLCLRVYAAGEFAWETDWRQSPSACARLIRSRAWFTATSEGETFSCRLLRTAAGASAD